MEKCGRIEEMILNGDLELDLVVESNEEIDLHIMSCESCSSLIREMKKVSETVRGIERLEMSEMFDEKLMARISSTKHQEQRIVPLFSRIAYYGAGIAAVMVGFFYLFSTGIFDGSENSVPGIQTPVQVASTDSDYKSKTFEDSLQTLKKNVPDDEDMRMKVSTGE